MSEIKILIEGYAKEIENGWVASSTVCLIISNGKKIITDPGCNREKIMEALENNNLKTSDIDFVLLTHSHLDHTLLAGIFEKAKILTTQEIYNGDNQIEHNNIIPETDLKIVQTPGHCPESCSIIVKTQEGVYAAAGDVFWWVDGENQEFNLEKEDNAHPEEVNKEKLIESRKKLVALADFIIPGHGKIFKVKK